MKHRPFILALIAIAHLLIAASLPIQVALYYEYSPFNLIESWTQLTYLNRSILILSILIAVAAWQAKSWLWHLLALNTVLIIWNHILIASWGIHAKLSETISATAGYLMLISLTLTESARRCLIQPNLHWWKHRRRRLARKVLLTMNHDELQAQLFDLSKTGAFIRGVQVLSHAKPQHTLSILVPITKAHKQRFQAEIVRVRQDDSGSYPAGVGIRFLRLSLMQRAKILYLMHLTAARR